MKPQFAIIAELPLGTYRAHLDGTVPDEVPSPGRLLSAMLSAAAQGPRAIPGTDGLFNLRTDDARALEWLEQNPPDGMEIPEFHVNRSTAWAYRVELIGRRKERRIVEKAMKPMGSVAVAGRYAFTWRTAPPGPVLEALQAIVGDVSHLGMGETPVRLRIGEARPTHEVDLHASLWNRGPADQDLQVARPGRIQSLVRGHEQWSETPSRATDRVKRQEKTYRPPVVTDSTSPARYSSPQPRPPDSPWSHVLIGTLDINRTVSDSRRVALAVCVHRALIGVIGDGAPSILTGVYSPDAPQPANRCAIQVLASHELRLLGWTARSAVALLIPNQMDPGELAEVSTAWGRLSTVRGPAGQRWGIQDRFLRRADAFWPAPPPGHRRLWETVPVAVPEVRAQRGGWSLADTVALSVGMVFRDRLVGDGRGTSWYRALVTATCEAGVNVPEANEIRSGVLSRFVHKTHRDLVIRPYKARFSLGTLAGQQTLLAIGQSRHLGGGLLVPFDFPSTDSQG